MAEFRAAAEREQVTEEEVEQLWAAMRAAGYDDVGAVEVAHRDRLGQ